MFKKLKSYKNIFSQVCQPLKINQCRLLASYVDNDELNELWFTRQSYFPAKTTPMLPPNTFNDKVAFITGGGTGLGAGMALMLSKLGAKVAIVSRNIEVLKNMADKISKQTNNEVLPLQCDVTCSHQVRDSVSDCITQLGLPTIVINNASSSFISPSEHLTTHAWKSLIDSILTGTINVTMDIGKRLIVAKEGGAFLNISTNYAKSGTAYNVPHAAAKSAIDGFTKSMASEWSVYGMRFNSLQPGPVNTEGRKGAYEQLDPTGRFTKSKLSKIPIGRYGAPEEIANLACYLVSDYANWMTGSTICFDGGELNFAAGEFNDLVENVSSDEWVMIESLNKNRKIEGMTNEEN